MRLDDILVSAAVKHPGRLSSKKRLFSELAQTAHDVYGLPRDTAFAALQERESLGPTGVGEGVALPHARLGGLDRVRGVFFGLEAPIDFDAPDRKPVDVVFALFAPEDAGVAHLKALALVSRTLRDPGLLAKLRANADPQLLHTLLTEAQRSEAA
ncbi:PTS sugar transporter subunit IIA [Jannaschia sp. W003]|uniref:PTS sugar transporter subunit IIA n=1 Tax=Jannaschia sp. W003 TaxID=2867012 RepID=UPI0021A8EAFE|nr:PTS sugar transporter subunit IIA [Jannaschia sp. W003]UWQ22031.1 PTS sugar transporter subunit IIA [Jannaschia sp. W003]